MKQPKSHFQSSLKHQLLTGNGVTKFNNDLIQILLALLPGQINMRQIFDKETRIPIVQCAGVFEESDERFVTSNDDSVIRNFSRYAGVHWLPELHERMHDLIRAIKFSAESIRKNPARNNTYNWNHEMRQHLEELKDIVNELQGAAKRCERH